jgi:hypothetical protein
MFLLGVGRDHARNGEHGMGLITRASAARPVAFGAVSPSIRDASSSPLSWGLRFLAVFATNIVVAVLAWVLVGLLMN